MTPGTPTTRARRPGLPPDGGRIGVLGGATFGAVLTVALLAVAGLGPTGSAATAIAPTATTSIPAGAPAGTPTSAPTSATAGKATGTSTGKATGTSAGKASPAARTTTVKPRLGGDGVNGFDRLTRADWPHPTEFVVVRPKGTSIGIWRNPGDTGPRLRFDDRRTVYGKLALLAVDRRPGFWRVALPVRPNGTTGWVREADVEAHIVVERVVVDLSAKTLRLYRGDRVVLETRVATGTGGTPTPQGLFFIKEIVPQANPKGSYGPIALGLSGFSESLKRFAGGSAIIAIHGTNAPDSIGQAASHGCVRVSNDVITLLARSISLGTPVEIVRSEQDLPAQRRRFLSSEAVAAFAAEPAADDATRRFDTPADAVARGSTGMTPAEGGGATTATDGSTAGSTGGADPASPDPTADPNATPTGAGPGGGSGGGSGP